MALFDNQAKNKPPLGVELIRRGLIKDSDINEAVNYQKSHPGVKLGEAIHALKIVPDKELLDVIAEQVESKPIILDPLSMSFGFTDYLSMDIVKQHKVMPFEIENNKLKIALTDSLRKSQRTIRRPGKVEKDSVNKIWLRREFGKEDISYEINKDNVLYKELIKRIPADAMRYFNSYMFEVEKNLPKFLIRDDMEENLNIINRTSEGIEEVQEELEKILCDLPLEEREEMLDFFITMQPFDSLKDKYDEIKKKVLK